MAGQMPRQKLGDQPRIKIVAAAGTIADQHADGLALVEIGDRIGARAPDAAASSSASATATIFISLDLRSAQRSASARLRHSAHGRAEALQHRGVAGERLGPGHEIDRAADGDGGQAAGAR